MTKSFALPLLGRRTRGQSALRQAYLPSPHTSSLRFLTATVPRGSGGRLVRNHWAPPSGSRPLSGNRRSAHRQGL
eukprot:1366951-Pyramimonas_sp.AAC.1